MDKEDTSVLYGQLLDLKYKYQRSLQFRFGPKESLQQLLQAINQQLDILTETKSHTRGTTEYSGSQY